MRRFAAFFAAATLLTTSCTDDLTTGEAQNKAQAVCLASLAENNGRLAENDCRAACELNPADKASCGAMALAGLQSLLEEIGTYVGLLKPSQSPEEFARQMETELRSRYGPEVDIRGIVNQFLGGILRSLRVIREGTYYAVGGDTPVEIPIEELPLDPRLLTFIYGRADTLTVKGHWTEKELALLGATANGLLSAFDLVLSHNMDIPVSDLPEMHGAAQVIAFAADVLNNSPKLLTMDDPDALALSRNEFHATMSLLAGRADTKEDVAQSNAGFLGHVAAEYAATPDGAQLADNPRLLKLTDVDGDGALSRGDNVVVVLGINGEDVTIGLVYPLSAKFTESVFQFLDDINSNMDGNKIPARIAPLYNSFIKELGVFAAAFEASGLSLDSLPDAVALDFDTFYTKFTGARRLLPYWYTDNSISGVNKFYFDGVTVAGDRAPSPKIFLAFETEELADPDDPDVGHFQATGYTSKVTWHDAAVDPAGYDADGVQPSTGYYFLWQDPAFAGLLNVNTTPFINNIYGMHSSLTTNDAFVAPADSRQTNAVFNAFIVWAEQ